MEKLVQPLSGHTVASQEAIRAECRVADTTLSTLQSARCGDPKCLEAV